MFRPVSASMVDLCGPSRQYLVVSQMHRQSGGKSARVTAARGGKDIIALDIKWN